MIARGTNSILSFARPNVSESPTRSNSAWNPLSGSVVTLRRGGLRGLFTGAGDWRGSMIVDSLEVARDFCADVDLGDFLRGSTSVISRSGTGPVGISSIDLIFTFLPDLSGLWVVGARLIAPPAGFPPVAEGVGSGPVEISV